MYKILILLAAVCGTVTPASILTQLEDKPLQRVSWPRLNVDRGLDFCPQCVNTFVDLINIVLNIVLDVGVVDTCGDLCDLVEEKSGSTFLGTLCTLTCNTLGIIEFVKLANKTDIDPIYYCEVINLCPINDNGDAKFKYFSISPPSSLIGTTVTIDFTYQSMNGTGTGELYIEIDCVDKIKIESRLLNEAQKSGIYGDRFSLDTTPADPDCDPTEEQCEQWLAGTYNVTIQLCNGICGSHHPHSATYDTIKGTFILRE